MKLVAKNYLFFGYFMYKYGSYPYISHALLFTKRQKKKKTAKRTIGVAALLLSLKPPVPPSRYGLCN